MVNIKKKADMTNGPIFFKMLLFTIPIMLTGLLQVAYNMADNVIVGQFSGDDLALAAVGSTSSMTTVIVNLLTGIGTGAGVVVAQLFGARDLEKLQRSVHTSMTFAIIAGVVFGGIGLLFSEPVLVLIGTKEELLSRAVLYYRIICLGIPASTVYNFGNGILRSVGNSKMPLYVLSISGLLNVILNIFFVICCGMAVDGVAIATVISQYASAIAVVVYFIIKRNEPYGISIRRLGIDAKLLGRVIRFGLPAGLQSSLFGISNIMLTSAVNVLPTTSVSAKTIAFNIDGMAYTVMNSYLHASMTFVGQNYGAKKAARIKKSALYALVQVVMIGIFIAAVLITFNENIISLYLDSNNPDRAEIIMLTRNLSTLILSTYFLCGIMDTLSGILRGIGNSLAPMLICVIGSVGIRAIWIWFFFPMEALKSLNGLYLCYPISWVIINTAMIIVLVHSWRKLKDDWSKENTAIPVAESEKATN